MSSALLYAGTLVMAATIAGLWRRGRLRQLSAWTAYLALLVAWQVLIVVEPSFFTWPAWNVKELAAVVLLFLVALQVGAASFRRVPPTRWKWSVWLLLVVTATAGHVAASAPDGSGTLAEYVGLVVVSRLHLGLALLLTGLAMIAILDDVPLRALDKSVLVGLAVGLLVSVVTGDQLNLFRLLSQPWSGYITAGTWLVVSGFWAREAWRAEDVVVTISVPAPVRRLWPWASPA